MLKPENGCELQYVDRGFSTNDFVAQLDYSVLIHCTHTPIYALSIRLGINIRTWGVFHEENLGKTYLNFIFMARINYNLDVIY